MRVWLAWMTVFIALAAQAENASTRPFGGSTRPVVPTLQVDEEPALCGPLLADVKASFASSSREVDIFDAAYARHPALTWRETAVPSSRRAVGSPETRFNSGASAVYRLDLDLAGDGRPQAVLLQSIPFNWSGDDVAAYVVASGADTDQVEQAILALHNQAADESSSDGLSSVGLLSRYFPSNAHGPTRTLAVTPTDLHKIFLWNGRYYHLQHDVFQSAEYIDPVRIFRLMPDGRVHLTCEVAFPGAHAAFQLLQAVSGLPSLMMLLRSVREPGRESGMAPYRAPDPVTAMWPIRHVAFRPWAVAHPLGDRADAAARHGSRVDAFLEEWSATEPWNRREYDTMRMAQHRARRGVEQYLKSVFGLPASEAKVWAARVVDDVIAASIVIPSDYEPTDTSFTDECTLGSSELNRALVSQDAAAVQRLLSAFQRSLGVDSQRDGEAHLVSAALHAAIEWPYGVHALLQAGADPNAPNHFGKTPLMVAAHLNRPDVVRLLLAAGAQVNLRTSANATWCRRSVTAERTALTYAAENASPVVMRLLLEAGADPGQAAGGHDSLEAFLALNPRLTEEEKRLSVQDLARRAGDFAGPSFDCDRGVTRLERAICLNEHLAMFDLEIDRAYRLLLAARHEGIRSDQHEWIKIRGKACETPEVVEADCLARSMRTRARYLHLLVRELSSERD